ncbi:TraR/DksA C4-type zinc finger protein [Aliiroseovarius sp. KMU-50]|uniref:TraR/DksA C4-type zinc finger protein n=1 Tax=Aliiroseovarius salicola TaxID=3009082 RepID=A0ABT4W1V9_9RHOB|nr:TraR/DksA C4-type zinc finger protein [Aliiroseovarius sp. KMU-50]MDA5094414.1 TraR/DksA C4-type zinc finger protein [Aliiroseovarius sp. KMU-50]
MNGDRVHKFKIQLQNALLELDQDDVLGTEGQKTVVLDQQAVGRLSRMDALQNQAMAQAQAARRNLERTRIHAALERIEDGEFGYCDDCGEPIAEKRLELDPCAIKCVSCASGL